MHALTALAPDRTRSCTRSGISAKRLELLESRLKDDVLSELTTFEGRILVASEADDGSVNPVWEAVEDGQTQVKTLREAMDMVGHEECGDAFSFIRVPITAEKFPEFQDRASCLTCSALRLSRR